MARQTTEMSSFKHISESSLLRAGESHSTYIHFQLLRAAAACTLGCCVNIICVLMRSRALTFIERDARACSNGDDSRYYYLMILLSNRVTYSASLFPRDVLYTYMCGVSRAVVYMWLRYAFLLNKISTATVISYFQERLIIICLSPLSCATP